MSQAALTKAIGAFGYRGPGYRAGFGKPGIPRATYKGGTQPHNTFGGMLAPATASVTASQVPGSSTFVGAPSSPIQAAPQTPVQQATASPVTTPATDPRDPTYWTNVGQLEFAYNNAVAQLGTRDTAAQTNLTNTLANLGEQEPIDQRTLRENYNNQGLFYSGHLGQAFGNLVQSYANRRLGAQSAYNTEHSDYLSRLDNLKGNLNFNEGRELNNAVDRQTTRDTATANNNGLATLTNAIAKPVVTSQEQQPITTSGAPPFRRVPFTNSQGVRGFLHIYPNGRKVFVRS